MTQAPSSVPQPGGYMRPHRGAMILVFGILGLVICVIFGIVAWVMGNSDLDAMNRGEMDKTGEGLTKAGKICGIISVCLNVAVILLYVLIAIFAIGVGVAGSGGP